MQHLSLVLYTREGCCLCEGVEEHLRSVNLQGLVPPLELRVIDIDQDDIPLDIRALYDKEVPVIVLALGDKGKRQCVELPRLSPRLKGDSLFKWLQKVCFKALQTNQNCSIADLK